MSAHGGSNRRPEKSRRCKRIALFGGTFDPIHAGHLAVARAAVRRFHLDCVYFIPCGRPPHKHRANLTAFPHRYAMVALACAGEARFAASLAEAGKDMAGKEVFYSVDTVRRFRRAAAHRGDHLYFLLGADSFLHIRGWRTPDELLTLCDLIVASRPGFPSAALQRAVPKGLRIEPGARGQAFTVQGGRGRRCKAAVYLLDTVASHVSATEVRWRLDNARSIRGLVPARVEEYISQQGLYQR
ncbi:MAG TPA: nicotinate-nucleotide adenylyltransferase [Methylomirabilota bacterium]|nr:nicotinate-nucleotide adenylyltransferase [Methylomirabilota bacterium]